MERNAAIHRILVVCVGNICRSPMAEVLWPEGYEVQSAGLGALVGNPADPHAVALMAERGIDLTSHRARQIEESMVRDAELVLGMDNQHVQSLVRVFPYARGRIHLLGRWGGFEIPDPYRQPRAAFEQALGLIETGIGQWTERMGKL